MFVTLLSIAALSGCAPLFLLDSSNFGDVDTVKRHLLDASWTIESNHYEYAERAGYDEDFEVVIDEELDTPGSLYFAEDSEVGRRELVYTDPDGEVLEGVFILEADVNNDNPTIDFEGMDFLFPEDVLAITAMDVSVFEPERFEFSHDFEGARGESRYRQTLRLVLED